MTGAPPDSLSSPRCAETRRCLRGRRRRRSAPRCGAHRRCRGAVRARASRHRSSPRRPLPDDCSTTTIEPDGPVYPLTGLPVTDPRPLLVRRWWSRSTTTPARPGRREACPEADIVYEEIVEGNITRLVAVFHSQQPDPVGPDPLRPARTTSTLLGSLHDRRCSRGAVATPSARSPIDSQRSGQPHRRRPRRRRTAASSATLIARAPHNLFTRRRPAVVAGARRHAGPATPFQYLGAGDARRPGRRLGGRGRRHRSASRSAGGTTRRSRLYLRTSDGAAAQGRPTAPSSPPNVVVLSVTSTGRAAPTPASPQAQSVGIG